MPISVAAAARHAWRRHPLDRVNAAGLGTVPATSSGVLNFNHLYYFHVTATEGAVKAAAEKLGVTQPTVSEQIRMLERSLGVQLFERAGGLRLTQAGRDAYEHTRAMFLAGERLVDSLGHNGVPPYITLRVGVSAAIARTVAADFLMPVLQVEDCRPSIRTGEFTDLLRDLRSHELDLVVGESAPLDPAGDFEIAEIHRPALVAIVHPRHEPLSDWQNLSLLEYRPASAYYWVVEGYLKEHGLRPSPAGELDDAFLMLEAVANGAFVAFVPWGVAREAARAGRVKVVATLPPNPAGVHAVYHSDGKLQLARIAVERLIANSRANLDS